MKNIFYLKNALQSCAAIIFVSMLITVNFAYNGKWGTDDFDRYKRTDLYGNMHFGTGHFDRDKRITGFSRD